MHSRSTDEEDHGTDKNRSYPEGLGAGHDGHKDEVRTASRND